MQCIQKSDANYRNSSSVEVSHSGCPGSIPGHVGFEANTVTLEHIISEYFDFPC
jgi:hypothetical protein